MGLMTVDDNIIRIGNNTISVGPPDPEVYVTPSEITGVSYLGATCPATVCGNKNNPTVVADACTWIITTTPVIPSASGTINNIQVCENLTSSCRSAVVCYSPSLGGTMKCVTICQSTGDTNIYVTPNPQSSINGGGAYLTQYVCGPVSNSTTFSTSCTWIHATTPVSPCASPGRAHLVCIDANTGAARQGTACYTPTVGTMRTITFCQNEAPVYVNLCQTSNFPTNGSDYYAITNGCTLRSSNPVSGTYDACFSWDMQKESGIENTLLCWNVRCNGVLICNCSAYMTDSCYCSGGFSRQMDYNDYICICMHAETDISYTGGQASVFMQMYEITSNQASPCYCLGNAYFLQAYTNSYV